MRRRDSHIKAGAPTSVTAASVGMMSRVQLLAKTAIWSLSTSSRAPRATLRTSSAIRTSLEARAQATESPWKRLGRKSLTAAFLYEMDLPQTQSAKAGRLQFRITDITALPISCRAALRVSKSASTSEMKMVTTHGAPPSG